MNGQGSTSYFAEGTRLPAPAEQIRRGTPSPRLARSPCGRAAWLEGRPSVLVFIRPSRSPRNGHFGHASAYWGAHPVCAVLRPKGGVLRQRTSHGLGPGLRRIVTIAVCFRHSVPFNRTATVRVSPLLHETACDSRAPSDCMKTTVCPPAATDKPTTGVLP